MTDEENTENLDDLDTKHASSEQVDTSQKKIDRRSITSRINFDKARKAKIEQLKRKKEVQEYDIRSDGEEDDEFDYDEEDEPAYVMKKRRPAPRQSSRPPIKNDGDALSMILSKLEEMHMKKERKTKPRPKQKTRGGTNIVINPTPVTVTAPAPAPPPRILDPMELMRVNQLKDGLLK